MSDDLLAGRYRLERTLGRGGMASVRFATDTVLDRAVAVKVFDERLAGDGDLRGRFLREGRLAAKLQHPHVVRVFDTGEADGRPYIVMEYVDGPSLAEELERRGPFGADEVEALGHQAALALAHAHAAGLVHRDVKPQNLLRGEDGLLKLVDFGIARGEGGETITEAGTILGTAGYLAPEHVAGERAGAAADVYSLGAVLYELLTGRQPRVVHSLADLDPDVPIPPVAELAPDAPARLTDAIARCLDRDPSRRPPAAELAGELRAETAVTRAAVPPTTETVVRTPPPGRARSRRRLWPAVAAGAVLALLGLGVALATTGGGGAPAAREPARVEQVPAGATPAEDARNLAGWLRENAG